MLQKQGVLVKRLSLRILINAIQWITGYYKAVLSLIITPQFFIPEKNAGAIFTTLTHHTTFMCIVVVKTIIYCKNAL